MAVALTIHGIHRQHRRYIAHIHHSSTITPVTLCDWFIQFGSQKLD